jgi:hypothetical protein
MMTDLSNVTAGMNETENVVFRVLVGPNGIVEAFDGESPMKILIWGTVGRLSDDNAVAQVHPC